MAKRVRTKSRKKYTITLDDDPVLYRIIEDTLGMKSIPFHCASELIASASDYQPIAAFIDIHLGISECGIDLIPTLKEHWARAPLIVMTSDPNDIWVKKALAAGADDFVRKPIRPHELVARFQTRLNDRVQKEAKTIVRIGDIILDTSHRHIKGSLGETYLSPTDINLLLCLIHAKGTVVSADRLKRAGWGKLVVSRIALYRRLHEVRRTLSEVSAMVKMGTEYGKGFVVRVKSGS